MLIRIQALFFVFLTYSNNRSSNFLVCILINASRTVWTDKERREVPL